MFHIRANKKVHFVELVFGWLSSGFILLAFALLSLGFLTKTNLFYIFLNIFGSAGLATVSFRHKDYHVTALNVVWFTVAFVSLVKLF